MRKIIIMMLAFVAVIYAAGFIYGVIAYKNDPFKRISSIEVQQALAADNHADTTPAAPENTKPAKTQGAKIPAAAVPDRVLGNPKAPVAIVEYASLTCPHCAHFHKEILPEIKKNYVDTGLVKLIFRPFPFDGIALKGSIMAYCLPEAQFYPFIDAIYSSQEEWVRGNNPEAELKKIARLAGLTEEKYKECSGEKSALNKQILETRMKAEKELGISSTPTFLIGGEKIEGAKPFEEFKAVLDNQLKQGKVQK
ncbi:MAG: DsbA family protein [Alphaproteobacteria bacterium]|nr:MAG: DsbA family protein [Alphaproteobacteria bacterium]